MQAAYYAKKRAEILAYKADDHYKKRARRPWFNFSIFLERLAEQGGKCAICRIEVADSGTASNCACADHCHKTNIQRGILCRKCNLMIGHANEREETLLAAIEYLRRWKT